MSECIGQTKQKYRLVSNDGRYYWEVRHSNGDVDTGWSTLRTDATLFTDPLHTPLTVWFDGEVWEQEVFELSPDQVDIRYYPKGLTQHEYERFINTLDVEEVEVLE